MGMPNWALGWLAYAGLMIALQILLCGGTAPDQSGNVAHNIAALVSGTYCSGLHWAISLVLFTTITIPGLILLFELISPFLNNAITGAIVGALGIVTFAVGFFS